MSCKVRRIMTFKRIQQEKLTYLSKKFPIIAVFGPRQSGKTTLCRMTFPGFEYVSLEELDNQEFAKDDPRAFLEKYNTGVIIDEAQRVPSLFSYIQTRVDETDEPGQYILTGSVQLQLQSKLNQSLAGRIAILKLLPMSMAELMDNHLVSYEYHQQLVKGFYPRIYKHELEPSDWYPNYIQTYLEKDVREMVNIKNLIIFQKFIKLCAGRNGQLLNIVELANDCGVSHQTATQWLSVLEASFILFLLTPYHHNFNKRLMKSPKLYFYDVGLVCSLLNIESAEQLQAHYLKGALFESYVICEVLKHQYNQGIEPNLSFWREKNGHEIDCIIEYKNQVLAVEVKSGKTISDSQFKGLSYWQKLSGATEQEMFLIYGGNEQQVRSQGKVLPWNKVSKVFE